jgi:hypothetical protein
VHHPATGVKHLLGPHGACRCMTPLAGRCSPLLLLYWQDYPLLIARYTPPCIRLCCLAGAMCCRVRQVPRQVAAALCQLASGSDPDACITWGMQVYDPLGGRCSPLLLLLLLYRQGNPCLGLYGQRPPSASVSVCRSHVLL